MSQDELGKWYSENYRPLPWRETKDPYGIWISEIMLQQTTVKAVMPFYERFMSRFPDVQSLSEARLEEVYEYWAGLGYYSRARNLHKAAQWIAENGFPKTHDTLMDLPGVGPYVSRAIASFAFDEAVGVLDGNVIRVLTRYWDLDWEWWKTQPRRELQDKVDQWVAKDAYRLNQAMMELGATICRPLSPTCLLCPLQPKCKAHKADTVSERPIAKPKEAHQNLIWTVSYSQKRGRVLVTPNDYAPFLKNHDILPGSIRKSANKPKTFDFTHSITKYRIYVKVQLEDTPQSEGKWLTPGQIKQNNPSSLIQKVLKTAEAKS